MKPYQANTANVLNLDAVVRIEKILPGEATDGVYYAEGRVRVYWVGGGHWGACVSVLSGEVDGAFYNLWRAMDGVA